jgi:hypothetical protein
MGDARLRGLAEPVGELDPGAAAVRWVYDAMRIDPGWSVWEDRAFTWWGYRQAQRVSSDAGFDDDGFVIYRLHAQADVLRDLDVT